MMNAPVSVRVNVTQFSNDFKKVTAQAIAIQFSNDCTMAQASALVDPNKRAILVLAI